MNKSKLIVFIFVLAGAELAGALSRAECDHNNICQISRNLTDDQGKTVSVPYRFKYIAPKNGAPTLIFIPGGPGQSSTQADVKRLLKLPEDYGVIQTDPMFVGVNKRDDMHSFQKATTSAQVARDIQLAMYAVNASDVVIYGASYGTVPGTILASQLSKTGKAPRAVVLDGILGRAVSRQEAIQGYATQWERVKSLNTKEDLAAFNKLTLELKDKGFLKEEELTNIMIGLLMFDSHKLNRIVQYAGRGDDSIARKLLVELKKSANPTYSEDDKWFHGVISCKELTPDSSADGVSMKYDYHGHFLATTDEKDCRKYSSPESVQLYDSTNYQILAPVIYLHGEYDPATPEEQALYHAKNQKNMNRVLKVVPEGQHVSLVGVLNPCSSEFFKALQNNLGSASISFDTCLKQRRQNNQLSGVAGVK